MYIVIIRTHMSMQDINVRMVDSMFGMGTECGLVGFCRGMLAGTSGEKRGGAVGADEGRLRAEQAPRTASNERLGVQAMWGALECPAQKLEVQVAVGEVKQYRAPSPIDQTRLPPML